MPISKALTFKEKTELDEYLDKSDLNNDLYEVLLQVREPDSSTGRYVLKIPPLMVFNEAYYQAGRAMADKHPEEDFYGNYFYDTKSHMVRAYETDLVLSMVYVIVGSQKNLTRPQQRFLKCIEAKIGKDPWYFPFFKALLDKYDAAGTKFETEFAKPEVDIAKLNMIDWRSETSNYNIDCINALVKLANTKAERLAVVDSLMAYYKNDVSANEFDFLFEDDLMPTFVQLRESILGSADDVTSDEQNKEPEPENPLAIRVVELENQISRLQECIGDLTMQNKELKQIQSDERSIKIRDLIREIRQYPMQTQIQMLTMMRSLVADIDENWIEKFKAEEDRLQTLAANDNEASAKKNLCLGAATDLMVILLKKANIAKYADNTKMAALISILTDYSKEKIRQRISDTTPLPKLHKAEVDSVNSILEDLGIDERLYVSNR